MGRLTLTFDNGPDPEVTPAVLEVLEARGLPATFFAVGDRIGRPGGRDLLERVVAAGHRVGNHSMTHAVPYGQDGSADVVEREIVATQRLIGDLAGDEWLMRPFGGGGRLGPHLFSPAVVDHLVAERYTAVLWNSVPHDWDDPAGWAARALTDLGTRAWTVLVLHDLPTGAMDHLPAFLDEAVARGTEVVAGYPDECVPLRRGVPGAGLPAVVAA